VWSSFGWGCSPFNTTHILSEAAIGVSARPCCGKLSLQSEEGRISFEDLGVDLGAEIFGALSDVHGSIGRYGISCGG
jgi:hypothetical protein